MVEAANGEWRRALALVRLAAERPDDAAARTAAFDFLRLAENPRLVKLAHLLQPGAGERALQAALVPLERSDRRLRMTDSEMGIRTTDVPTASTERMPLAVIADNVRSAFNMGGIFRAADFFGVERLVLCGYSPDPENAQVRKTALGADESTPWERFGDVRDAVKSLRERSYAVYALETVDCAADVGSFVPSWPCALILGNERFGIDPDVVADADGTVVIPSHGTKNSLNVVCAFSVAAAFFRKAFG